AAFEKEFANIYSKEFSLPNIRRFGRPKITEAGKVEINGRDLKEFLNECATTVFMSASEGAGASVVQTMHAGLVPIVTPNTGIDERAGGIIISDPTVEKIKKAVIDFAALPPEKIEEMARQAWSFAREHHTREAFTKNYGDFIDNILKL
ncbi:MAG TPA: glycosyltransferase, partial [Candidatus Paceibacterota bacterium]